MRKKFLIVLGVQIALLIFIASFTAAKQTHSKKQPEKAVEAKAGSSKEMAEAFARARKGIREGNIKGAAKEIRKAETMLRAAVKDATDEARDELQTAADDLEALAKKTEKGNTTGRKEMNRNFARAHNAMARYHREKAKAFMANKENSDAGEELKESAAHLERAMVLTGRKAGNSTVGNAKKVGNKMVKGKNWSQQKVSETFDSLGEKIDEVGSKIKKSDE